MEKEQFDGLRKAAIAGTVLTILVGFIGGVIFGGNLNFSSLGGPLFQLIYLAFISPARRGDIAKITWLYVLVVLGVITTVIFLPIGMIVIVLNDRFRTAYKVYTVLVCLVQITATIISGTYFHKVRGYAKLNAELKTELV